MCACARAGAQAAGRSAGAHKAKEVLQIWHTRQHAGGCKSLLLETNCDHRRMRVIEQVLSEVQDPIDLVSDTSESTGSQSDSDNSSVVAVVEPTDQAAADVPCLADLMATARLVLRGSTPGPAPPSALAGPQLQQGVDHLWAACPRSCHACHRQPGHQMRVDPRG